MSIICPKDPKGPAKFRCAQGGCRECLEALMEQHEGLVHSVLRQQSGGELSYEELLQAGRIGLWRAVLQFDTRRGVAFSTYAWMVIKRKIWQEVAQSQRPQGWLKPEPPPDPRALAEERLWWEEVYLALVAAVASLPPRQQEVIRAVCGWEDGRPRSLVEIGRQWGVTRQAATYWYYKALVSLRLPAVSGQLRQLWGMDSREDYQRSQKLNQAWLRRWRGGRAQ